MDRWLDEDGNAWGVGHQNKTAFAAWAVDASLEVDSAWWRSLSDKEQQLEEHEAMEAYRSCDVFYAWADITKEESKIVFEPSPGLTPITGIWA